MTWAFLPLRRREQSPPFADPGRGYLQQAGRAPLGGAARVPQTPGWRTTIVRLGNDGHTARVEITTKRLLIALLAVDAAGGAVAMKHRVAGEPFGIGGSLDVRNPAVVVLWGTALSAPVTSLGLATALYRHRPGALRVLGAMFALGALSEPAFWGRRPCPWFGRMLIMAHVFIASALAIGPVGIDGAEDHIS